MAKHLNEVFGNRDLCAWQVATGVYWVQTRKPFFTNLLRQRQSARLVSYGVAGGYLRIYEVEIGHRALRALLDRWTSAQGVPGGDLEGRNTGESGVVSPETAPNGQTPPPRAHEAKTD